LVRNKIDKLAIWQLKNAIPARPELLAIRFLHFPLTGGDFSAATDPTSGPQCDCVCGAKRAKRRRKQGRKTKADKSEMGEWKFIFASGPRCSCNFPWPLLALEKLRCNWAS